MKLYENYCLPCMIDMACGTRAIRLLRAEVVALARGRVLEVGMGSGLNLPFYLREKVQSIFGLEPSEAIRKKAAKAVNGTDIPVEFIGLPAEEIPLEDESVDSVVLTFTLCSIPDWQTALQQMRRVLKPEGKLIFCEHGLAPEESRRDWQKRLNPYWRAVAGGCNLDRPITELIERSGFQIETLKQGYAAGLPKLAGYVSRGVASKKQ